MQENPAQQLSESAAPPSSAAISFDDRSALAALVQQHGPLIRARIRRKLSPGMRRLFDSQDVLSTLFRRVDLLASKGELRASSEAQLIALLVRIADNAVVDRARIINKLNRVEGDDHAWSTSLRSRIAHCPDDDASSDVLASAFEALQDNEDRTILGMWLNDTPLDAIAQILDRPASTVRWRWGKIRSTLHQTLVNS
jgi:DNA-directed RNA polymerase specialized sigma24 family protein